VSSKNKAAERSVALHILQSLYWFFHARNLVHGWNNADSAQMECKPVGDDRRSPSFVAKPLGWPETGSISLRIHPGPIPEADVTINASHLKLDDTPIVGLSIGWAGDRGFYGKDARGKRLVDLVNA